MSGEISPIPRRMLERGLEVEKAEIEQFPFDHADIGIAEAMLAGAKTAAEIAQEAGVSKEQVRERLMDPIRCAWISAQLEKAISTRLGRVLAAVYTKGVQTGDVSAARFLLQMFKKFTPETRHLNFNLDFRNMTIPELEAFIADQNRRYASGTERPAESPGVAGGSEPAV